MLSLLSPIRAFRSIIWMGSKPYCSRNRAGVMSVVEVWPMREVTSFTRVRSVMSCRHFVAGDGHGAQHLLHHRHLLGQFLGHALAGGLVIGVGLVAEGGLLPVKGHTQRLRLFLVHEALEHVQKAENGVGIQPVPCGQGLHAVKGAVDDAVAVKNHQFHGRPPCGVRFHRISYYSPFSGKTQPPVLTVFAFVIDWSMFTPI